jgi:1-acyl-sn-glycerol-3-phosphate acyltransferase
MNIFDLLIKVNRIFLESISEIEVEINDTKKLKPPYVILSNHVNNLDPFFINAYVDKPISYLASDEYFRNPILKNLLKFTGAVPKTKFKSDFSAVKELIKMKNNNRIIGIFPEGKRSWDGTTDEFLKSTLKLLKLLKISVVVVNLKGAHLSSPRWADKMRKGKIIISYKKVLSGQEIKEYSLAKINEKIISALQHDEYNFQTKNMNYYKGKKLAEKLELFLFACPNCRSIDSMKSHDNNFFCKNCDYHTTYTNQGLFSTKTNKLYFNNPRDWNIWQLDYLKSFILNNVKNNKLILQEDNIFFSRGTKAKKLKKIGHGRLILDNKNLYFLNDLDNKLVFNFNDLIGLNIQYNNKLEFYYKDTLFRFDFKKVSAYKWLKSIQILNQIAD